MVSDVLRGRFAEVLTEKQVKVAEIALERATDEGVFKLTQREWAKKSGVSVQTVSTAVKKLTDAGYLVHRGRSGFYWFIIPETRSLVPVKWPKLSGAVYKLYRWLQKHGL